MSPTQWSLQHLRELGYQPEVVEKIVPRPQLSMDMESRSCKTSRYVT